MSYFDLISHGGFSVGKILPDASKSKHGNIHILTGDMGIDLNVYIFDGFMRQWKPFSSTGSVHGGIFFVDVTTQNAGDNIGEKNYADSINVKLDSFISDTNLVRLKLICITGHSNFIPNCVVEGIPLNLTPLEDKPLFEGWIDLDITNKTELIAMHEDGARHIISCFVEEKPKITFAEFVGEYQGSQIELKSGDKHKLQIRTDKTIAKVQIENSGACQFKEYIVNGNNVTVDTLIADRGNTSQLLGAKVRVQTANGSWSDWYDTSSTGNVEKVNVVKLNNTHPSITVHSVIYSSGFKALKDNESATINHTISNYDTVSYSSPNGELSINNVNVFEGAKTATRQSGDYNVTNTNFTIEAIRNANGAKTIVNRNIGIAHSEQVITITEEFTRLRSSDTGSNYEIILNSDQVLLEKPTLLIPAGTWTNDFTSTDNMNWKRTIRISDTDLKGIHSYVAMSSKNLAGKEVIIISGDDTYEVGGFTNRKLTFPAFVSTVSIGTNVTDVSKLSFVDMSGYVYTYQNSFANNPFTFTIVGSSGNLDPNGSYLRITDVNVVNQNSTGTFFGNLEESI